MDGREDCSYGVIRSVGGAWGVYQGFKGAGRGTSCTAPSTVTPDVPNGYLPLVLSLAAASFGARRSPRVSYVRPPSSSRGRELGLSLIHFEEPKVCC